MAVATPSEAAEAADPAPADEPVSVYERLRDAYARADARAAAELYAPDATWYDAGNQVHRGREAVAEHLRGFFATRGPVLYTVKRQVTGPEGALLAEWTSAWSEEGRRSTGLPGATSLQIGPEGISYHRDYQ
ncbi:MAG TPA: nuclear transport factor 2 family protein [Actinomycetes bacterium]|nr:nuclear transport factor 2 family protein [Actinomycetes bacterium]